MYRQAVSLFGDLILFGSLIMCAATAERITSRREGRATSNLRRIHVRSERNISIDNIEALAKALKNGLSNCLRSRH
jgi:hypothetical protein